MMGGWDRWEGCSFIHVWISGGRGGGQGVGIISEFFLFELLFFVLSCVVSFLSEQSMIAVVSFCL